MNIEVLLQSIVWVYRKLKNPIVAGLVIFLVFTGLSIVSQQIWESLLKIVIAYILADLLKNLIIQVGDEVRWVKITPSLNHQFNSHGHGFLIYFTVIIAGTLVASSASSGFIQNFLHEQIDIAIKAPISFGVVILVWLDMFSS